MTLDDGSAWQTSVHALVSLFRDALLALLPTVERAQIPWREGEAYDAWDEIAAVLFAKIVRDPVAWGLNAVADFELAEYDLALSTWRDRSFIAVKHVTISPQSRAVFLRFATGAQPLDTVVLRVIDDAFKPRGSEVRLPFADVTFELQHRRGDVVHTITRLSVPE